MKKPAYLGLVLLVAASMVLLFTGRSQAVSTKCWNCHTMHNSQNGLPMAFELWDADADPNTNPAPLGAQPVLLRSSCVGCHSATGSVAIFEDKPIVWSTGAYPTPALAGGNFYNVGLTSSPADAKGHNCDGVSVGVDGLLDTPPGFVDGPTDPSKVPPKKFTTTGTWGPPTWPSGQKVTCAGLYGCHGDRSVAADVDPLSALKGAHHGNAAMSSDQVCDGAALGTSYRFLAGIVGQEQNNDNADSWEYTVSSAKHNGYYGVDATERVSTTSANRTATISFLCAQCHGVFHDAGTSGIGTASPWLRHPTDIAFSDVTTNDEFDDYTVYDPVVPVGAYVTAPPTGGMPIDPIVLCVSCHRAHGSPYDDLLRWEYAEGTGLPALPASSCGTCHTNKVAQPAP